MSDSFLPSGGFESRRDLSNLSAQSLSSPSGVPRTFPLNEYFSPTHITSNSTPSPKSYMPSQSQNQHGPPLSPPKTRSPSADTASAALVEDWRAYTSKLRSQHEGERAHMVADRARMEELHVEERRLWDLEKKILLARIAELETQLSKAGSSASGPMASFMASAQSHRPGPTSVGSNPMSVSSSRDSSSAHAVPQESGRDANGSPFYAPAPRNPSRTFDSTETNDLRIDSITSPGESAIRVTSKELTPSDFVKSPPTTHDLEPIPENIPESIDISQIQPELEGVAIKTSAVSPDFIANVLSPQFSPGKLSPSVKSPPRDVTNQTSLSRSSSNKKKQSTLEVVTEPENRRLTMHAGHTPNHSLSVKLPWVAPEDGDSGNSTPRQGGKPEHLHRPSVAPGSENFPGLSNQANNNGDDGGDVELRGPLGLTNESANDDPFLAALVEKLEEAKKSRPASPDDESVSSRESSRESAKQKKDDEDDDGGDKDEGPRLRLKPSVNFGRPFGSM